MKLITLDGPAGAGKSTAGALLARRLGWDYVTTGMFYRGVAALAQAEGIGPDQPGRLAARLAGGALDYDAARGRLVLRGPAGDEDLSLDHLQGAAISRLTPRYSRLPEVREALLGVQRGLLKPERGLVADGRDCGTRIWPDAPLKVWVFAHPHETARRFSLKLGIPFTQALADVLERDAADRSRSEAPMVPAPDAVQLDTTGLGQEEVVEVLWELARRRGFAA